MRWILIFLFLYLIPIVVLFKNYKNFKRSCIYSSIYIVLATTIAISNMYMSGLNKIKEAMYYQNYANDNSYEDKYTSNFDKEDKYIENNIEKNEQKYNNLSNIPKEDTDKISNNYDEDIVENNIQKEDIGNEVIRTKDDLTIINDFKNEIYDIEKIALIPMRDCMPYTKNIAENLKKLGEIKKDIEYAKEMCNDVVEQYKEMDIPTLSEKDYTKVLNNARDDLKKTYELREKAMDSAIKLIDTKNPKYIGKINEYLKLSDNHIESYKERLSDLKDKIDKK